MKKTQFKIVERRYSWESRGYDKDCVEISYGIKYDVVRGEEILDSFFSKESATEFINLHTTMGKALHKKLIKNEKKIERLEDQISLLNKCNTEIHKTLQVKILK